MANINTITEIIASIKTIYSYYAKDTDVEALVKTWNVLLKNYPDNAVEVAFYKCLQTCKTPPTPADVIEQLNAMIATNEQTDEELWSLFTKAVRQTENQMYYFPFTFVEENGKTQGENAKIKVQEIWDNLPEKLKTYLGGKSELLRIAKTYTDEELKYERNRFFKTMPTIAKRQEYTELKLSLENKNSLMIEKKDN